MAFNNLYHVFYKMPALYKEDMYVELENLAENLVKSGLLRIEAEPKQNFTRFSIPTRNVHIVFSKRELYTESLYPRVRKQLFKALSEAGEQYNLEEKIAKEISKLKEQLKRFVDVESELEMQIARILVQSAHPIVFSLIIFEQVEVFVSYGQSIGEVMDVFSWQQAGSNSGMQSTDGKNVAVFVSCGGDPLLLEPSQEENKQNPQFAPEEKTYGDGTPALARMMGIAGQETGHYSDIIHNKYGQQIGRYSANFNGTKANPKVDMARNTDMKNIQAYWQALNNIGISRLIDRENAIKFYRRNPNKSIGYYLKLVILFIVKKIFIYRAYKMQFLPINDFKNKDYVGTRLQEFLSDMSFNLAPVADVYKSSDKNVEIAIACIEALARVPQQVNKWGHSSTLFLWRNLYKFYYYKVIPGCIKSYEEMSGNIFAAYPNKLKKFSFLEKLRIKFERWKNKNKKTR